MKKFVTVSGLFGFLVFAIGNIGMRYGADWGHGANWGMEVMFTAFPIFWYASSALRWLPENHQAIQLAVYASLAALQFMAIGAATCWTWQKAKPDGARSTALVSAIAGLLTFAVLLFFNPSTPGFFGWFGWGVFPPIVFPLFPTEFPSLNLSARVMVHYPSEYIGSMVAMVVYAALAMAQFVFYGVVIRSLFRRHSAS